MTKAIPGILKLLPALTVCALIGGCGESPAESAPADIDTVVELSETERLNAWFDEKYEEQLDLMPMS